MHWRDLIIGPQLVGLIFILAGWVQLKFPPKKINSLYGYRTALSMKNQPNWDEGNRYSAQLMIRIGAIMLFGGLLVSVLLQLISNQQLRLALTIPLLTLGSMLCVVIMLGKTERHLEKFEKENQ